LIEPDSQASSDRIVFYSPWNWSGSGTQRPPKSCA